MDNLYHWHNEEMVRLKMEDFRREMDKIRLINEAGLSNPGLFERLTVALGGALVRLGRRLHTNVTEPHQAYQVTSSKYAG